MSTKRTSFVEVIFWILAIVLLLLAVTPFALGFKVKSDYTQMVTDVAQIVQLDMQIDTYEQGIFSSDAVISVTLPGSTNKILFREEIIHGPVYLGLISQGKSPLVAAVIKGELDITVEHEEMVQQIFAGNNPLLYQNIIGFNGDVESQAYVPAVNTSFEDELGPVTVQSSGAILNQHYAISTGQLKGDIEVPAIKIQSAIFNINTQSLSMSFSGATGENHIMIGDSVASMSLLDFVSGDEQVAIRDLTIRSITSESGVLINSGTQISAREILASNQKFGPVQFNLSLNGLDTKSLLEIQAMQKELEAQLQKGVPAEQVNAMMSAQLMGLVPALIRQAELQVNPLSINSELGKLEADIDFKLEGIDANTPADPMFLLSAISLEMNMSIDEQLLKQFISWELNENAANDLYAGSAKSKKVESNIPLEQKISENIQGMLDENWLIFNEGVYMSKISMHQGELLINEHAVDPMQQIMSSMGNDNALAAP